MFNRSQKPFSSEFPPTTITLLYKLWKWTKTNNSESTGSKLFESTTIHSAVESSFKGTSETTKENWNINIVRAKNIKSTLAESTYTKSRRPVSDTTREHIDWCILDWNWCSKCSLTGVTALINFKWQRCSIDLPVECRCHTSRHLSLRHGPYSTLYCYSEAPATEQNRLFMCCIYVYMDQTCCHLVNAIVR